MHTVDVQVVPGCILHAWFDAPSPGPYSIGDTIDWFPHFDKPGEWINGVHEAENDNGADWWIIIKDQTIVAAVGAQIALEKAMQQGLVSLGPEDTFLSAERKLLAQQYDIPDPPRELWPEMSWEAAKWREDLYDRRWAERLEKERERIRATWKPPEPREADSQPLDLFAQISQPAATLEEALKQAEASCAVNQYTRAMMRRPGTYRCIMGPWDDCPELSRFCTDLVQPLWRDWVMPNHMLEDAVRYVSERGLREAGLWDSRVFYRIDHEVVMISRYVEETIDILKPSMVVTVQSLRGHTAPEE